MTATTPLVRLDGVWKKFQRGEVHDSLRDLIPTLVRRALGRRSTTDADLRGGEFWALSDISAVVEPGQTLGVIGSNGAGKSTLLKILTRILRPNSGSYEVRGRIGALIEVAAGFHPDLTGRENIFLQGAMMGMPRSQTRRKLDEIVAFSEVEAFLETPVKRYSSGMNARLGFSIAAHLDPDVLIIDEVLAVGDYAFQRKAFGRIRDLARSGIPAVIVSHQLDRVAELCTQVMYLESGRVAALGAPTDVIGAYLRSTSGGRVVEGASPVTLGTTVALDGNEVRSGGRVRVRVSGVVHDAIGKHVEPVGIIVRSAQTGEMVYATGSTLHALEFAPGPFTIEVELQMNVQPGIYVADVGVYNRADEKLLAAGSGLNFRVLEAELFLGSVNMNATMAFVARPAPLSVGRA